MPDPSANSEAQRYSRQMLFTPIGERGQKRLRLSRICVVGCGALGGALANILARAGVGSLRIIDRDFIEMNNLQRQPLFDEHDIAAGLPKAEAAARKLRRINSAIEVEGVTADITPATIAELCGNFDLLLDGTDNLETRYILNDFAVQQDTPWVYGACIGAEGRVMSILPGKTACLCCIYPTPPSPGELETCDTAGVIGPIVEIVASLQAVEAIKIMIGSTDELARGLISIDAWQYRLRTLSVQRETECVCCARKDFKHLNRSAGESLTLCGREAIQITPAVSGTIDFKRVQARLPGDARPVANPYMLRFQADRCQVTLFADGRAIIQGVTEPAKARGIYARYIGT